MKAYKVITRKKIPDHKIRVPYSAIVHNKAGVFYKKLKWVTAPEWLAQSGYHLLAFKSFKDAEDFVMQGDLKWVNIWEVELKGIIEEMPQRLDVGQVSRGDIAGGHFGDWPEGTIMAKKVKLIKKVK